MGVRSIRRSVAVALCAAAFGAPAHASLGSVISSFYVADNYHYWSRGVSRDSTYLYWVVTELYPGYSLHYDDFHGGGGSVYIRNSYSGHGDADASILGPGYFADICYVDGVQVVADFDLATGLPIGSWAPLSSMTGYAYNPELGIRYVGDEYGRVHRYDSNGSFLGSFLTAGPIGLAAASDFAGYHGEYIIVTKSHYWYVYNAMGVEVDRVEFPIAGGLGESACGPGNPAEYGTTLWCMGIAGDLNDYVFQISMHNATAVTPASVGRIKALYR